MKKIKILIGILIITLSYQFSFSQKNFQGFVLSGTDPTTIEINQTFTTENEIFPFDDIVSTFFGLALSAQISLENDKSLVRVILVDKKYEEHLIYEAYSLLKPNLSFSVDRICEETCILNSVKPQSVRVEITDATITINSLTYVSGIMSGTDVPRLKKEKKQAQNNVKINEINKNLKANGLNWVAGPTSVSEMTYTERKKLFGQSMFPLGFEYYSGGVIKAEITSSTRETSLMVDNWDWRDRHGKNWITPVTDQGNCNSCWAFATTGAAEAMVNLYFNQLLNLDLAEQDVLSCSGAGDCGAGGSEGLALDYITSTGVVDEGTFPYTATDQPCLNKGTNPSERIKIGGKIIFPSNEYPRTEDDLKRMIIERGPISGGLFDWWHAMVMPGYQVVEEGDVFYYRDLNLNIYWITIEAGDPLIGETVWIFKNSWGVNWGDNGYVYVETNISNIDYTHALLTPVQSLVQSYEVVCEDNDGDGYYWWGLGEKPANCDCPDEPDGDDSDPTLGPLDEYGYCTMLVPPVADFTGNPTVIMEGQTVTCTDQSTNNPTSWSWSFPGGEPSSSSLQNPVIIYPTIGIYDVSLTATNNAGSDALTKTAYIDVSEYVITYCTSSGNDVSKEWIQAFELGAFNINSGTDGGYGDYTSTSISVESGQSYNLTLTPGFSGKSRREFWRIWIDYNMDGDFTDSGEEVFSANRKKGVVTGNISLPTGVTGETRMRISMKYNAVPSTCEHFPYGEVEDYTLLFGTPVPQPPVANFSGIPTTVSVGNSVQFTDLSASDPTTWTWTFPGGTPGTSTDQDPLVTYNNLGTYDVTLMAVNDAGSDTITKTDYIVVTDDPVTTYCEPTAINNAQYFIDNINIGGQSSATGKSSTGYTYYDSPVFTLVPGSSNATLVPNNNKRKFYWRMWLDTNGDGDFDDTDETLLAANNVKGTVSEVITIPAFTDPTRLRISMKTGGAAAPCDDNFPGEVEDYDVIMGGSGSSLLQIEENENMLIELYPNPVTGNELHLKILKPDTPVSIRIFNTKGELIDYFQTVKEHSIINITGYSTGIYFIKISDNKHVVAKMFVKMQ